MTNSAFRAGGRIFFPTAYVAGYSCGGSAM